MRRISDAVKITAHGDALARYCINQQAILPADFGFKYECKQSGAK
jgi:hypothetical protein